MRPDFGRLVALCAAMICLVAGGIILRAAGLPQRADSTGVIADGTRFAPEINSLAPPFSLLALDGTEVNLVALRGQPVILNFWATWCEPCEVEMPELQAFANRYADQVTLIGVNLGEPPPLVATWLRERNLAIRVVLDSELLISQQYALRGQPTTFVISPEGRITAIFYGATTMTQLEAALSPVLIPL